MGLRVPIEDTRLEENSLIRKALEVVWKGTQLNLYFVGDTHNGSAAARTENMVELASRIANDDKSLVVGLGDYIEAIAPSDRRFDPSELAQPISPEHISNLFYCQALNFAKLFEETRGKWAAMVGGNHEITALNRFYVDPTQIIADRLGCSYLGGSDTSGWIRVKFRKGKKTWGMLDIYCIHGWGGGELRGGDSLKMQRLLWRKDADILAMGHCHRPGIFPETVEYIDQRGWEQQATRWGIVNYPMVDKHGYLARRGGNAPPVGYIVLEIEAQHDGKPRIRASMCEL